MQVSEFEFVETALRLAGQVDRVWVDFFARFPLTGSDAERLRGAGFRLCVVSPELQRRSTTREIPATARLLVEQGVATDAVCAKSPERWTKTGLGRRSGASRASLAIAARVRYKARVECDPR